MTLYGIYACLRMIRRMIRHTLTAVSAEDFFYWVFAGFYLFMKIFDASEGTVRWYFAAGTLLGALLFALLLSKAENICRKFYRKRKGKE